MINYTIYRVSGDLQCHASVRDQAIRLARNVAQGAAVDLWYLDDRTTRLLEVYRRRAF